MRYAALLLFATLFTGSVSIAQPGPEPQQIALLIGNSDYNNDGTVSDKTPVGSKFLPDLIHPCGDTKKIETALSKYDFKIEKKCDLKPGEMGAKFAEYKTKIAALPPHSTVFIYYSGHGLQFDSEIYAAPILFQPGQVENIRETYARRQSLMTTADQWNDLLRTLPKRDDIAIAVVIDACRNSPFKEASVLNEKSTPEGNKNQFIYWTTNGGNTSADSGMLSDIIVNQIEKGGTIGTVITQIWHADHTLFKQHKKAYEGYTSPGGDFTWEQQVRLRKAATVIAVAEPKPVTPTTATVAASIAKPLTVPVFVAPPPGVKLKAKTLRHIPIGNSIGMTLDLFVCEGPTARERLDYAADLANRLAPTAHSVGIGAINVRYLWDVINATPGYHVRMNVMRYDFPKGAEKPEQLKEMANEKRALISLAEQFPEGNFVPQPGVGNNGLPTDDYISAFICGELAQNR